jgi:hypothetical protein
MTIVHSKKMNNYRIRVIGTSYSTDGDTPKGKWFSKMHLLGPFTLDKAKEFILEITKTVPKQHLTVIDDMSVSVSAKPKGVATYTIVGIY